MLFNLTFSQAAQLIKKNNALDNDSKKTKVKTSQKMKTNNSLFCLFGPLGKLLKKVIHGIDDFIEKIKYENNENNASNDSNESNVRRERVRNKSRDDNCNPKQSCNIIYHKRKENENRGKSVYLSRAETHLQFHGIAVEFTDLDEKKFKMSYLASKLYQFYPIWNIGRGLCIITGKGYCVCVCECVWTWVYVCVCV